MKHFISTETLVLECLSQTQENYGRGIKDWIKEKTKGEFDLGDSSLYPALSSLSSGGKEAKIRQTRVERVFEDGGGRPREYYVLTKEGEARIEQVRVAIMAIFNVNDEKL